MFSTLYQVLILLNGILGLHELSPYKVNPIDFICNMPCRMTVRREAYDYHQEL